MPERRRLGRAVAKVIAAALCVSLAGVALAMAGFRWQAERREVQLAAQAAPATGRFVRAADVDMFVQEMGPPAGPALLFVHGTGAWSETWRESMTMAAQAGFHAIAVDLPPFGFSSRPQGPGYSRAEQAARIVGVLDALHIGRVTLIGHSFGGGPTVETAFLAPQRVRALVLVDVALGLDAAALPDAPPGLVQQALNVGPVRDAVVASFLTNPLFTRHLLQMFIADPVHASPQRVQVYQRPLALAGSTPAIGAWLPTLFTPERHAASARPAAYARLAMPVRIIWGGRDSITPPAQGRQLAALIPGAQLAMMPAVGHIPQIEDGAGFNALLLATLQPLKDLQ